MMNPEIGRQVATGVCVTNVHVAGDGPALLLIHASGPGVNAWATWKALITSLSGKFRIIAPDMAGFGYTETSNDANYEPNYWIRQLDELCNALQVGPVCIIGSSFGGAIALAFAAAYPERVEKLILIAPLGVRFCSTPGLDVVWGYKPSVQNMKDMLRISVANKSLITDEIVNLKFEASLRPGVQERYERIFSRPSQDNVDRLSLSEEALRHILQPTLIIHGSADEIVPQYASERLHALLPNSELVIFDNVGHGIQIEAPGKFNQSLNRFLGLEQHTP
jgi:2-hydroxymuconate-semialdehyde hydrolase